MHARSTFEQVECPKCERICRVPGYFGGYELYEKLSESITSSLFKGFDPRLGRNVSLKILNYVLSRNSELVEAFKREALAAAALNSSNVLKVYEFGIHNHQPFMVLEHIEGRTLHDLIQEGSLTQEQNLEIVEGIVQGLEDTHEQGIVHGDVMPRNILIHTDGTARISDFGLARFSGDETELLDSWSSPYYMPPERIKGETEDHRGDFYSLGTTLYYMLTGRLPYFDLDDDEVLRQKLAGPPPNPREYKEDMVPELAELAMLLLELDPEERPDSFESLKNVLTAVREAMPVNRPDVDEIEAPPTPLYKTPNPVKEEPLLVIILFCLIGVLGALLLGHFSKQWRNEDSAPAATATPAVTPEATPTPSGPTPTPTPVPTPAPTATPTPLPTPTPIPAPSHQRTLFLRESDFQQNEDQSLKEWSDASGKPGFIPASELPPPTVLKEAEGPSSLSFSQNVLISGQTPHRNKTYTLIVWVQPDSETKPETNQLILGVDPRAPGERRFMIYIDQSLPGSYTFETEKGSTRLILPVGMREGPIPLALVRGPDEDVAYAGALKSNLTGTGAVRPDTDFKVLPAVQMGGLVDQNLFYKGQIFGVSFYDRPMDPKEVRNIFEAGLIKKADEASP